MSERKVPAPFLTKTYELVDDPITDDVVSWNESGTTFVVSKTADFARDLLPNYFKHSNFSSFIRQLNTYGFRKIVTDRWEFANENFRRGQQELLAQMHRRKTVSTPPSSGGKSTAANPTSVVLLVNSGDDQGSSSTSSSPNSKNRGSVGTAQFANLSGENEKLRRENLMLNSELAHMKKQCDELIAFLTKYVNVGPDQINYIMSKGFSGSIYGGSVVGELSLDRNADDDEKFENNSDDENKDGECLKLFGVLMKEKKKKRGRDETNCFDGANSKEIKSLDTKTAWLQISSG